MLRVFTINSVFDSSLNLHQILRSRLKTYSFIHFRSLLKHSLVFDICVLISSYQFIT